MSPHKESLKTRGIESNTDIWLNEKAERDTAMWGMPQGMWAIDGKMYNLEKFIQKHPGGPSWIQMTKGHDITVLFRTHHLEEAKTRKILQKYYVGLCPTQNEHRFSYENYNELRGRILEKYTVTELQNSEVTFCKSLILLFLWFCSLFATACWHSYFFAFVTSFVSMCHYAIGHLFVHKADNNLLRNVFLFIGFTAKEQQIMHVLSHHPHTNTELDYEYSSHEPLINFARNLKPNSKYVKFLYEILMLLIVPSNIITKLIVVPLTKGVMPSFPHLVNLFQIVLFYLFCNSWIESLKLWLFMTVCFGFFFGKMLLCPHRQEYLWSEGAPEIKDYVLHNICCSSDYSHESKSWESLLKYSGFNIHVFHHLFPTIDHNKLNECNQIFQEFCEEKGMKVQIKDLIECNVGTWRVMDQKIPFEISKFSSKRV